MHEPADPPLRLVGEALEWAREHPAYFFATGVATVEELVEQVASGVRALGVSRVEVRYVGSWAVVAAHEDWFANARFPVPEDFAFTALTPFPEWGANTVRPECVVAAFAQAVIVRGPHGVSVVKGSVPASDPALVLIRKEAWARAVAFRGVGGA